jgi:hypothetical protein
MTATTNKFAQVAITMTEEERAQLLSWLEQRLKNKLVEEHRTETAAYRDYVLHQETILESLINKLREEGSRC